MLPFSQFASVISQSKNAEEVNERINGYLSDYFEYHREQELNNSKRQFKDFLYKYCTDAQRAQVMSIVNLDEIK